MCRLYFWGYLYTDQYDKANKLVGFMNENSMEKGYHLKYKALLEAKMGDRASALATLDSMELLSSETISCAKVYAILGDKDQMYKHLEQEFINYRGGLLMFLAKIP